RDPEHVRKHLAREPGDPVVAHGGWRRGPCREVQGRTPMTNDHRKSDRSVVPKKRPNKAERLVAEGVEGRDLAKGNSREQNAPRTQRRTSVQSALERVRQAASKDRKAQFTALLHHIYNPETQRAAYLALKREAAPGVDGETWQHYGQALEANLQDLSDRLKRGAYRAKPVRRVYIPKADGRQRPLGVTALEDKVVQRATVEVLNAIYETDFLGFSYGFRPKRSQHNALDGRYAGLLTKKVNWVLDLDIRGFFDAIDHGWLVKFIEHRIADQRVVRLIQKWLNAGVLEDGKRTRVQEGTPQGGSASPLLATSICTTCSMSGSRHGGRSKPEATSSSSGLRTTSCWDFRARWKPSSFRWSWRNDSESSIWSCTPTRRDSSSSGPSRPGIDVVAARANRIPLTSSASRTSARRSRAMGAS